MNKLYKIRRISDGRFYKGKSKFTKFGTYFRLDQIKANINWVKSLSNDIEIVVFSIEENITINISNLNINDIEKILNRNNKIDNILYEEN